MKTKPYQKASEITNALWQGAADAIGCPVYALQEVYIVGNWIGMGAKWFCEALSKVTNRVLVIFAGQEIELC